MGWSVRRWSTSMAFLLLTGCTPAAPYRTELPARPPDCPSDANGAVSPSCRETRHERTDDYDLLFVEFDDQGLLYPTGPNPNWPAQINEIMTRLHTLADSHPEGMSLFVFVHGWKHNASVDDENVMGFRKALKAMALVEQASQNRHRVIGIYVAWRGLSSTVEPFLELSFWERKATALYVAQGSARGLLTRLKGFQQAINCKLPTDCVGNQRRPSVRPTVRFILVGHSFGGLILFNAISGDLVEGLTYKEDSRNADAPALRVADMVVLLNPAFEATRYTPLHRVATNPNRSFKEYQAPVFVSITSTADWATGLAFPAGRFINTIFEKAASPEESTAIKNTMGHVDSYITHKLVASTQDPPDCQGWRDVDTIPNEPEARLRQMQDNLAAEARNDRRFFGSAPGEGAKLKEQWARPFCGSAVLSHIRYDPNSPIWNVQTDKSLMKGHSDIEGSVLTNFLRQLYKDSYLYP